MVELGMLTRKEGRKDNSRSLWLAIRRGFACERVVTRGGDTERTIVSSMAPSLI